MLLTRILVVPSSRSNFRCLRGTELAQFHTSSGVSSRDLFSFHKKDKAFNKQYTFKKLAEKEKSTLNRQKHLRMRVRKENRRVKKLKKQDEIAQDQMKPLEEQQWNKKKPRKGPQSGTYTPKAEPDEHVEPVFADLPIRTELASHIEKQQIRQPPRVPDEIKPNPMFVGSGRRKSARVMAIIKPGTGRITINGRNWVDYFKHIYTRGLMLAPVVAAEKVGLVDISVFARGGGFSGQAEAGARAIANAFINGDPEMLYLFRQSGMQQGDLRVKERKHTGKRAARKKQAWVKR